MEFKHIDLPEDITAQGLAFDPILPPEGTPYVLVQDETGSYWLQISAPAAKQMQLQINLDRSEERL